MWYGSRAIDEYSGTSYEHRQAWVEDKVLWLSTVFTIGISRNQYLTLSFLNTANTAPVFLLPLPT